MSTTLAVNLLGAIVAINALALILMARALLTVQRARAAAIIAALQDIAAAIREGRAA